MRSRKSSLLETWSNQIVGIIIGYIVMLFLLPYIPQFKESIGAMIVVGVNFVFSYSRAYSLSRLFVWLHNKGYVR